MDPKIPAPEAKPATRNKAATRILTLALFVAAVVLGYLIAERTGVFENTQTSAKPGAKTAAQGQPQTGAADESSSQMRASLRQAPAPPIPSKHGPVVELKEAESSAGPAGAGPAASQSSEQAQRKAPYGLKRSVDVVVRSDESVKVAGVVVSVAELERELVVGQRGQVLERPLGGKLGVTAWGVHLVRPQENLWNIHYHLLREFLAARGIRLPENADEPTQRGYSSGVGKVLKFAEHMVGVYNVKTKTMSQRLDALEPGKKVVIFNLSEIFEQLSKIEPQNLKGVVYDGRVLLFPGADIKAGEVHTEARPPSPSTSETR